MTKRKAMIFPWRNERQLRGVRSQLTTAINTSEDGAYAQVDLTTARNLLEICDQAIRTEIGYGNTQDRIDFITKGVVT